MHTVIFAPSPLRSGLLALGRSVLLVSAGLLGLSSSVSAANAEVTVTVAALQATVNKNVGSAVYAAYSVKILNSTKNVINQVTFSGAGTTSGSGDSLPTLAGTSLPLPPGCSYSSNVISCAIGQLRGIAEAPRNEASFVLWFKIPEGTSTSATTPNAVKFTWNSSFSSGNSPNSPPANYVTFDGDATTTLNTAGDATAASPFLTFVPPAELAFSTGATGVPNSTDKTITKVVVNGVADTNSYAPGKVVESPLLTGCTGDVPLKAAAPCRQTDLTIPFPTGTEQRAITVTLFRDVSDLPKCTKVYCPDVLTADVYYQHTSNDRYVKLDACSDTVARPCVSDRYVYPDSPTNRTLGLAKDWRITIQLDGNGSARIFD